MDEIIFSGKCIKSGKTMCGDLLHSPVTSEYKRLYPQFIKGSNIYYIVTGGMMKQVDPESVRNSVHHKHLFKR